MTLIYTDAAERQGSAWAGKAALPNQTLWQASMPTRLFQNRSIRVANAPAMPSTLVARPSAFEDTRLLLACQAGRCFGKASESLLASVFSKQLQHSCIE
jgi:hypothetical protein